MSGRKQRRIRAFTLIELLLVLVILAILAGVVVPKFVGRSEQAKMTRARMDIKLLDSQCDYFNTDMSRFPTGDEGFRVLVDAPADNKDWHGPYLKEGIPVDPWGNPYQYRFPAQQNKTGPDIWSFGPDGRDGGGDDIDNWTVTTK